MPANTTSPRLVTIVMVEKTLQDADEGIVKFSQLKRMLPRKVNHNTLKTIIDYLQKSNKVYVGSKGICWIVNDSPKLAEAIARGTRFEDLPKRSPKRI